MKYRFLILLTLAASPAVAQETIILDPPGGQASEPPPVYKPRPTPSPTPAPNSLADIVRRSQGTAPKDEGEKKRSLGVISNDTVKGASATPGATTAKKGSMTVLPKPALTPKPIIRDRGSSEPRDLNGHTQADWAKIVSGVEGRLAKADAEVRRLEVETKRLENDFYAWGDGSYRDGVIKPTWDQAKTDLAKARQQLDDARAQQANLEDDARKAGAPPGWLREVQSPTPRPTRDASLGAN